MNLIWTSTARADAREIITYVARSNTDAAFTVRTRLEASAQSLIRRNTGRPSRMSGLYEKSVPKTRLILAYKVTGKDIEIIRVIHSAQNWTPQGFPES